MAIAIRIASPRIGWGGKPEREQAMQNKLGNLKLTLTVKTPKTIVETYGKKGQMTITRPNASR